MCVFAAEAGRGGSLGQNAGKEENSKKGSRERGIREGEKERGIRRREAGLANDSHVYGCLVVPGNQT